MQTKTTVLGRSGALAAGLALFAAGWALGGWENVSQAQSEVPTEHKGVSAVSLGVLPDAPNIARRAAPTRRAALPHEMGVYPRRLV